MKGVSFVHNAKVVPRRPVDASTFFSRETRELLNAHIKVETMEIISVTLQSLGDACHLKVDGKHNADWLRKRLKKEQLKTSRPVHLEGTAMYTFQVPYSSEWTHAKLQRFLWNLTEVNMD